MIDINNFDSIKIGLTSPKQIRAWSSGEVTKPETINYRTLKPEKDGLFCERIFGPTKDWECYCGKYKRVRYKGIICERCGVEVTRAKVRRERMGHIDLAAPVSHIWFFKGVPSRIGYILDIAPKELEKVLYFAASIITEVDAERRATDLPELEEKIGEAKEQYVADCEQRKQELQERMTRRLAWLRDGDVTGFDEDDFFYIDDLQRDRTGETEKRELTDADRKQAETELTKETVTAVRDVDRYTEEAVLRLEEAWMRFRDLRVKEIISDEQLFREMRDRFSSTYGFGEYFKGGMGASAIRELLASFDLETEAENLRATIRSSKGQRHAKALKRLKVVTAFLRSDNRPEWMVLDAVPVIPPELRPMVQLDGGRFATSDLNDLYRRVINRNNRLKRLLDLGAPEIIVNNEKRMLQEAVDALFDNGRRGRAVTGPGNRPLKSLADMLKGKQGRFRQNLLGKRVDYSGRSVIVAGPELRLHQCGLPKLMALELFKPFIMSRLVERKQVQNIKAAKKLVDSMIPEVWDVLEEVIAEHPVLLNRAPTLHRLGIQAFEPILVEGKAIQIHPLVCAAFNADFDGDQMAVHLPLSVEAQAEARILMLSSNNILSPAHGKPITVPTQDMVIGLYYLTYCPAVDVRNVKTHDGNTRADITTFYDLEAGAFVLPKGKEGSGEVGTAFSANPFTAMKVAAPRAFRDPASVNGAVDHGAIGLHDPIVIRMDGERIVTTPGRVIFNSELKTLIEQVVPAERLEAKPFPSAHKTFTKKELGLFIETLVDFYGPTAVSSVLDGFKTLGFRYASKSGITISKNDIIIPPDKAEIIARYEDEVQGVQDMADQGLMSSGERHEEVISLWEKATDEVADAMINHLYRTNPIYMMAHSGARGSFKQIRQLAGMRGCMANPKGEIIERPIKSNFMEGLSVLEYFISTHGARKGLADTALKTADSGYLTRRLVDVAQDVIVRDHDCGTDEGINIKVFVDRELNLSLTGRIIHGPAIDPHTGNEILDLRGEAPAEDDEDGNVRFAETLIGTAQQAVLRGIAEEHPDAYISVRSPLKCRSAAGLCALCYGLNPGSGRLCEPGDAVGIIAAQSIGEPGTQLTMRTFHTGGVAGADITAGLPRVVELFEARKPKALAHVAKGDGWISIEEDEELPPGAVRVRLTEAAHIEIGDKASGISRQPLHEHTYVVPRRTQVIVPDGAWVEAGDLLTVGSAWPADVLEPRSGVDLGVSGDVSAVSVADEKKTAKSAGGRFMRVAVTTPEGDEEHRVLRIPADRPDPEIVVGMEVRAGVPVVAEAQQSERSTKTELYIVQEVQEVYRSQGVEINDKHIEVICRQMLRKVKVIESGDTPLLPGQLVDKPVVYRENAKARLAAHERLTEARDAGEFTGSDRDFEHALEESEATYEPLILGITKASLATESFLSAASFQETTKVLTDAALEGRTDYLRGLKENVIIGKLIPAATGLKRYRQLEIEPVRRAPALLDFDLDEPFSMLSDGMLELDDLAAGGSFSFGPEPDAEAATPSE